jgi:pimeloyl-ACP methyl ester carboxylesterase
LGWHSHCHNYNHRYITNQHAHNHAAEHRHYEAAARQLDDYRAVIGWARDLDGVDRERIVLWGTSFSGGHVLTIAAADARIAAVISQAPYTDSIPTLMCLPPRNIARVVVEAVRDQLGAWLGRPPRLVPALGAPGTFAMMTAPGAESTFAAIRPPNSKWRNEFAARVILTFGFYRPGLKAKHLKMPLLMCVCDEDATTPMAAAVKAAERAPRAELRHYPYGHFDIYLDPRVKADQVAFLQRTVQGVSA